MQHWQIVTARTWLFAAVETCFARISKGERYVGMSIIAAQFECDGPNALQYPAKDPIPSFPNCHVGGLTSL